MEQPARTFPRSIVFILFYALLERYATYGVGSIMAVFLSTKFDLSQSMTTAVLHYFFFAAYGFGVVGAIIADNWIGRYKTLLYGMSGIGAVGTLFLVIGTIGTLPYLLVSFTIIAYVLITFGLGCLEPNLPAYSGDQFILPLEAKGFSLCFGLLFFMQNVARIFAAFISPIIRKNTSCFGDTTCYPLIYGIFFCAKFVAILLIVIGKRFSIRIKPKKIFNQFTGCISNAISLKSSSKVKKDHWLDHSIEKYGEHYVDQIKRIMKIFALMPALMLQSTLYFQQGSRWVFQASQMNRKFGKFEVEPDQVQVVNAISVIILVFVCEYILNPLMAKVYVKTALHRISVGIFAAVLSFVLSAILQFQINSAEVGSIHVTWMVPQYFLLALGEVIVYVQFTQFAYREAPIQLKSILQATFSLVIGGGNLIVGLIATIQIFEQVAYELLLFAGIGFISLLMFIYYASKYEYVKEIEKVTEDDLEVNEDLEVFRGEMQRKLSVLSTRM